MIPRDGGTPSEAGTDLRGTATLHLMKRTTDEHGDDETLQAGEGASRAVDAEESAMRADSKVWLPLGEEGHCRRVGVDRPDGDAEAAEEDRHREVEVVGDIRQRRWEVGGRRCPR